MNHLFHIFTLTTLLLNSTTVFAATPVASICELFNSCPTSIKTHESIYDLYIKAFNNADEVRFLAWMIILLTNPTKVKEATAQQQSEMGIHANIWFQPIEQSLAFKFYLFYKYRIPLLTPASPRIKKALIVLLGEKYPNSNLCAVAKEHFPQEAKALNNPQEVLDLLGRIKAVIEVLNNRYLP